MHNVCLPVALACTAVLSLCLPRVAWAASDGASGIDAAQIAKAGNGHGAAPCMACHGADGGGLAAAGYPRLAGLDKAYLLKQLDDYTNGTRKNAVMHAVAGALSEPERRALAAYYSAMPVPRAQREGSASPPAADTTGARLARFGRWSHKVPACVRCHGPHGVGVGANFPPLAGQPASYLASQLDAWRNGTRRNDPLGLMEHVATQLSDSDIQSVSQWFAAQPAVIKGGAR